MEEAWVGLAALAPRFLDMAINLVVALLILVIGWWVSALLGSWVRRVAQRSARIDPTIVPMFHVTVVWAVRIFTLIAVLARFGVQTASLIAMLGAAGLAIGLALQGTLQNIAAGIMLLILRPLRTGEYVALSSGTDGTVQEVGLFLTRLVQGDGIVVTLPNSVVWGATITNYSRNVTRRMDIPVVVPYGEDLDAAIDCLTKLVADNPAIHASPAPVIKAMEYRDNGTLVNVRAWADASTYWDVRWDMFHRIRKAMDSAGFKPPVPVRAIQGGGGKESEAAAS